MNTTPTPATQNPTFSRRLNIAFLDALLSDPNDTLLGVSAHLTRDAYPDMTESMTTEDVNDLTKLGDRYELPPTHA